MVLVGLTDVKITKLWRESVFYLLYHNIAKGSTIIKDLLHCLFSLMIIKDLEIHFTDYFLSFEWWAPIFRFAGTAWVRFYGIPLHG